MEDAIRDHPLWAGATDQEVDCAMEVLSACSYLSTSRCLFQTLWMDLV